MSNSVHPGWRLLGFVLAFLLLVICTAPLLAALGLTAGTAAAEGRDLVRGLPATILLLLCALGASRLVDRLLGPTILWARDFSVPGALRTLAVGLLFGLLLALVSGLLLLASGAAGFTFGPAPDAVGAAELLVALLVAAALEEALFRGALLRLLDEGVGREWALVFSALAFGGLHAVQAGSGRLLAGFSLINVTLAGILLGLAYVRSGRLWLPLSLHTGWNFGLGPLLGLPVSGIAFPRALLQTRVSAADWLGGGSYGPEGGLAATLALGLGCCIMAWSRTALVLPLAPWRGPERRSLQPPSPKVG